MRKVTAVNYIDRGIEYGDARLPKRFWDKVVQDVSGCWVWGATKNAHQYGIFKMTHGRKGAAHRIAFNETVYRLPDYTPRGPQLDHLCSNRSCVNPSHLEVVAPRVNILRGNTIAAMRAAQTACIHGHAFTVENTTNRPDGTRGCRSCQEVRNAGRKERLAVGQ
jgi:hypothetical protein